MRCLNFSDDQQNSEGNQMSQTKFRDDVNLPDSVNTDDGNCGDNTATSKKFTIAKVIYYERNIKEALCLYG